MNNTFNLNRFGLLIRKQWLESGKLYLISLGILAGVSIAIYSYACWDIANERSMIGTNYNFQMTFRWPLFFVFGTLFLSLAANHYFAPLGQKPKAILELTLPASNLEKFLTGILYSTIFALLSYLLIFYLIDLAFVSKLRAQFPAPFGYTHDRGSIDFKAPEYFFNILFEQREVKIITISGSVILISIFTLGSLFFKKFQYLKTIISALVFTAILLSILIYCGKMIFDTKIAINNNSNWGFSHLQMECMMIGILLCVAIITYAIAYIRFKEKEV